MINKINIFKQFLLITALFFTSANTFAQQEGEQNPATSAHESKKFDAGKMIIEHVADNHEWHLFGHTAIALPVIIKSDKGVEVFSSSHFGHEGKEVYAGANYNYALREGSVVVVDENGAENEEASAGLWDLSLTKNVVAMFVSMILMLWMFLSIAKSYKNNKGKAPRGLQSFIEPLIIFVRDDVAKPSIGVARYERFMPFLLTVFFFIWINNLLGLIPIFPGGANVTGSISIALVLAVFTFLITLSVGNKHYWRHILAMPGVPLWVLPLLTIIEIMGVFLRPFVLMVRLFANITAGHIIAMAFFSLIFIFGEMSTGAGLGVSVLSIVFTVFMCALELLVAFLQAYVFTLLSAIYFGAAVDEGHDVHNHVDDFTPDGVTVHHH